MSRNADDIPPLRGLYDLSSFTPGSRRGLPTCRTYGAGMILNRVILQDIRDCPPRRIFDFVGR